MPDCYLHVGTHKTGTTAVQNFLLVERENLLGRGVLVPSPGLPPNGNHVPLVRAFCGRPAAPKHGDLIAKLDEELRQYPSHNVLLSAEAMEKHFLLGLRSEIVAFFRSRGYDVKLICYVRPQQDRINASYAQNIKTFRANPDFRDLVTRTLQEGKLSYSRWSGIAEEQAVELIALPYNKIVQENGVLESFLRVLGLGELAPPSDAYRRNPTVGTATIAAARTCMDRLKPKRLRLTQRQRVMCRRVLLQAEADIPSARFCGLDRSLVEFLQDHYSSDNDVFAEAVWRAKWNDVFGEVERDVVPNEIARDAPGSPGHSSYVAILDRVWQHVLAIAEDPDLSDPEPWETDVVPWPWDARRQRSADASED